MVNLEVVGPRNLWYVVGLITTDGNLSPDRRHLNITSKDITHLQNVRTSLGLQNKITMKGNGVNKQKIYGALQFGDVVFYRFLESVGLHPNKSKTLGPLKIPPTYFSDFLRGVIDGDGSIRRWIHPQNKHEQWALMIVSAAPYFVHWLSDEINTHMTARGSLEIRPGTDTTAPLFRMKFGKVAARRILQFCYRSGMLSLARKQLLAEQCIIAEQGWNQSFTVGVKRQGGGTGYTRKT